MLACRDGLTIRLARFLILDLLLHFNTAFLRFDVKVCAGSDDV
jgi:hypothetical protein